MEKWSAVYWCRFFSICRPLTLPAPWTATVGGKVAQVLFAGVTPGYASLYQVNAMVPAGIAAGPDVAVALSVDGQSSPPVTVAIQ